MPWTDVQIDPADEITFSHNPPNSRPGPYECNGTLYCVFMDQDNENLEVWKTPNGADWAQAGIDGPDLPIWIDIYGYLNAQDPINYPLPDPFGTYHLRSYMWFDYSVCRYENILYIVHYGPTPDNTDNPFNYTPPGQKIYDYNYPIKIARFDLSTETWLDPIDPNISLQSYVDFYGDEDGLSDRIWPGTGYPFITDKYQEISIVVTVDDIIIFYNYRDIATSQWIARYARQSTSWVPSDIEPGLSTIYGTYVFDACPGSSGKVYVAYNKTGYSGGYYTPDSSYYFLILGVSSPIKIFPGGNYGVTLNASTALTVIDDYIYLGIYQRGELTYNWNVYRGKEFEAWSSVSNTLNGTFKNVPTETYHNKSGNFIKRNSSIYTGFAGTIITTYYRELGYMVDWITYTVLGIIIDYNAAGYGQVDLGFLPNSDNIGILYGYNAFTSSGGTYCEPEWITPKFIFESLAALQISVSDSLNLSDDIDTPEFQTYELGFADTMEMLDAVPRVQLRIPGGGGESDEDTEVPEGCPEFPVNSEYCAGWKDGLDGDEAAMNSEFCRIWKTPTERPEECE